MPNFTCTGYVGTCCLPCPKRLTQIHACTSSLQDFTPFVSCSCVTFAESAQRNAKKDACIAQLREELGRLKSQCSQVCNDHAVQHSLSKLLVILLNRTCMSAALLKHYMHWLSLVLQSAFADRIQNSRHGKSKTSSLYVSCSKGCASLLLQAVVREDCDGSIKSGQSSPCGTDSTTAPVQPVSEDPEGVISSGQSSPPGTDGTTPLVATLPSQEPHVLGPYYQIILLAIMLQFELGYC